MGSILIWVKIGYSHTIECVWERRTSMFPVLDTNLWFLSKDMTVPFKIMKLAEVHDKTEITMGLQSFNSLKLEVFCSSRAFK